LVIGGVSSGVGKTTIAAGLMRLLATRGGLKVGAAKVGPDFIDPGYHRAATGHPSRNLDGFLCDPDSLPLIAAKAASGRDILIIEGVMGLFDGAILDGAPPTSTAAVAKALGAPVVLVADAGRTSSSVAAMVKGFFDFDDDLEVAGVIVNNVASPSHEFAVRRAFDTASLPLLGVLPRDPGLRFDARHLGLIPVVEQPSLVTAQLDRIAAIIGEHLDMDAIIALAARARRLQVPSPPEHSAPGRARIGVLGGAAFDFVYLDNLEELEAGGAELVTVDPLSEESLPADLDGLYLPGGFPEVYAGRISENTRWRAQLRAAVEGGMPTWAECGGLLVLAASLDELAMAGALDVRARMTNRLTLGYVRATIRGDSLLGPEGTVLRGHEFHYSETDPPGDALEIESRHGHRLGGFRSSSLLASYVHLHLGSDRFPADRFVDAAVGYRSGRGSTTGR
jgi:cobyrinic acid a,c-diamide synthase